MSRELPRRFCLHRVSDTSGVSGVGIVAEGCQFSNGRCALTWTTNLTSLAWYDNIQVLEAVHGHGGATQVVWCDPPHQLSEDNPTLHIETRMLSAPSAHVVQESKEKSPGHQKGKPAGVKANFRKQNKG